MSKKIRKCRKIKKKLEMWENKVKRDISTKNPHSYFQQNVDKNVDNVDN